MKLQVLFYIIANGVKLTDMQHDSLTQSWNGDEQQGREVGRKAREREERNSVLKSLERGSNMKNEGLVSKHLYILP